MQIAYKLEPAKALIKTERNGAGTQHIPSSNQHQDQEIKFRS